jgi:hypothetical protein
MSRKRLWADPWMVGSLTLLIVGILLFTYSIFFMS